MTILKSFFFSLFRSRSRSLAPGKQDGSETLVRGVYGESDSQELSTVHHALNLCCIKTEFVTAGTDATLCLLLTYCTVYLLGGLPHSLEQSILSETSHQQDFIQAI